MTEHRSAQPDAPHLRHRRGIGWWLALAVTLVMTAVAAWFGWHVWTQWRFTGRVEKFGGECEHSPMGPDWLIAYAPQVYLDTVTHITRVRLSNTRLDDAIVHDLAARPQIIALNLNHSTVTDAQLAVLASHLPNLQSLALQHTPLTDAAVEHLAQLTNLRVLDLTDVPLTRPAIDKLVAALPGAIIYHSPGHENTQNAGPLTIPGRPGRR